MRRPYSEALAFTAASTLVSEAGEVIVQPAVHFPLGRIGRQIADQRGLGGIFTKLFERGLIVLHQSYRSRMSVQRQPQIRSGALTTVRPAGGIVETRYGYTPQRLSRRCRGWDPLRGIGGWGGPRDGTHSTYLDQRFSGLRCGFSGSWYTKVCADGRLRSF